MYVSGTAAVQWQCWKVELHLEGAFLGKKQFPRSYISSNEVDHNLSSVLMAWPHNLRAHFPL